MWCWKTKRIGKIDKVSRSIVFGSIEMTGTRKKFPITLRKRCSSTFPESSTCAVQEPPFMFCASWSASSREGTPLASKRSTTDWLAVRFTALVYPTLGQIQHTPDRNSQGASHALRVILLQTRNRVAYLIGKDAVDRAAIIAQPRQIALQRANVSRLRDQLSARFEVIKRPPAMSRCKI